MKKFFIIVLVAMATVTTNAKSVSHRWGQRTTLKLNKLSKKEISVKMKSVYAEMIGQYAMYVTPNQSLYDLLCTSEEDVETLLNKCENVFGINLDSAQNVYNVWMVDDVERLIFEKANAR